MRYVAYRFLRRALPSGLQDRIGSSKLWKPLRDRLLRPEGASRETSGSITWEDLEFFYASSYRGFYKAQGSGVENRICRLARSVLQQGDTAIDVGASYGFVTHVLALSVRPSGRVFAFEIDDAIRTVLRTTLAKNHLEKIVSVAAKGAGDESTDNRTTVDELLRGADDCVRFLKIDVDGDDLLVLRGASRVLDRFHPVVVVEMERRGQEIYDLLCSAGYTHFIDLENRLVESGPWPPNLIASTERLIIPPRGRIVAPFRRSDRAV